MGGGSFGHCSLGNRTALCRKILALGLWRANLGFQPTKQCEEKCDVKFGCTFVQIYRCQSVALSSLITYILTAVFATSQKKWPHLPDIVTSQPDCRLHNNIWQGGCVGCLLSPHPQTAWLAVTRVTKCVVRTPAGVHVCGQWILNTCMFTALLR